MLQYCFECCSQCPCCLAPRGVHGGRRKLPRGLLRRRRVRHQEAGKKLVHQGRPVQVDPMNPMLKAPVSKNLKLKYDKLLSNFGFIFNLRHYTKVAASRSDGKSVDEEESNAKLGAVKPAKSFLGRAVLVESMKPVLKVTGTRRLKLKYDKLLSSSAFNFNSRRYSAASTWPTPPSPTTPRRRWRRATPAGSSNSARGTSTAPPTAALRWAGCTTCTPTASRSRSRAPWTRYGGLLNPNPYTLNPKPYTNPEP